jgi:hypothetical protein
MNSERKVSRADRIPAAILVAAAGLMLAGASIGAFAPSLREAPWSDDPRLLAQAIAGNPSAFVWANALFLAAAVMTALALTPISIRFNRGTRPWALSGLTAFFFAAILEVFNRLMSISIYPWAAQQRVDLTGFTAQAFIRLDNALGAAFHVLGFLALVLYGIAMIRGVAHRRLGWLFAAGGAIGVFLQLIGAVIPAFVFFGTAALGVVIWFYGTGPDDGA